MRRTQNTLVWARVILMLGSLIGIFYAMAYFKSGKAFKDPHSASQILIGPPPPTADNPEAPPVQGR